MEIFKEIFKSNVRKETSEARKKRLIEEGKATESDYDMGVESKSEVELDPGFQAYAFAKSKEEDEKKKPKTKAGRAVSGK